jgi:S1-C subfamily serine protease
MPAANAAPAARSEPASRSPSPTRRTLLGIGWFGLWLDTITDTPPGVIVGRVASRGPAADAGIEVDDVLIEVAGQPVTSFSDVENAVVDHVANTPPGTSTVVEVVRNGRHLRLSVVFDPEFNLQSP